MHLLRTFMNVNIIIALLLFFVQVPASADDNGLFDIQSAIETFDEIDNEINAKPPPDLKDLREAINAVEKIQLETTSCEKKVDNQLSSFKKISKIGNVELLPDKEKAEYEVLERRRLSLEKQLAECRLLLFRTSEALKSYKLMAAKISASRALYRHQSVMQIIKNAAAIRLERFSFSAMFDTEELYELLNLDGQDYILACIFSVIILLALWFICRRYLSWLAIGGFFWPIAFFLLLTVFSMVHFRHYIEAPNIVKASRALLVYFIFLPIIKYLLNSKSRFLHHMKFLDNYSDTVNFRATILLTLLMFGFVGIQFFKPGNIQPELSDIFLVSYLTILVFVFAWTCWPIVSYLQDANSSSVFVGMIKLLIILILCVLLISTWSGYHKLALLEVRGLTLSSIVVFSLWVFLKVMKTLFRRVDNANFSISRKLHNFFAVKMHKKLYEFGLIKLSIYVMAFYFAMVALMFSWSFPVVLINNAVKSFFHGYMIFDVDFNLSRFVVSALLFSLLSLSTRLIVKSIAMQDQPKFKRSQQVALASIVNYCGFAVSLLISLLVAGVDFTGLAIIAGALSVGVGLGLQDIVKNFVAGVILLLEKSIKPGDRVIVGGTEGHVKKIRIRATQITTMQRSDVIVPNAEFISAQVTNYMFRQPILRISNTVGVAYGSDIKKVADLLLQLAQDHPDVLNDKDNFPRVLFREFTECSLHFELRNFITDVNRKNIIMSELNFRISEEFDKHNIEIAFPQLDVRIRKDDS